MSYLPKSIIYRAYHTLSGMTQGATQGATQFTSSLRYTFALDRFCKAFNRPCDTRVREDRDEFTKFVGEVVAVGGNFYVVNFYGAFKEAVDFSVGSNFMSVNTVRKSLDNANKIYTFPQKNKTRLFEIQNGILVAKPEYLVNLSKILPSHHLQLAFAIWLLRNADLNEESIYSSACAYLSGRYSAEILSQIQFSEESILSFIGDEHLVLTPTVINVDELMRLSNDQGERNEPDRKVPKSNQIIFYGAPGTGKSHTINRLAAPERTVRTTFHPDSDYASFVGAYKPTMEDVPINAIVGENVKYAHPTANHPGTERKIVYKYVPQAFLRAYVAAWKDLSASHYLVIEEINRGNCAQIFGDLFQLLDRTDAGFSSYPIDADADIAQFLAHDAKGFGEVTEEQRTAILGFEIKNEAGETVLSGDDILNGTKLVLPNNLYIWATMNTSDQSLFPIDSAFKRRWNWKYVPIDYHAKEWMLEVNHKQYRWGDFLQAINPIIVQVTESPDKQMGYFFVRAVGGIVDAETFLNKVIFYLWTDVFKDFGMGHEVFQDTTTKEPLAFTDFFSVDGEPMEDRLEMFISNVSKTFQNGEVLKALGEEDETEVDDNVASEEA